MTLPSTLMHTEHRIDECRDNLAYYLLMRATFDARIAAEGDKLRRYERHARTLAADSAIPLGPAEDDGVAFPDASGPTPTGLAFLAGYEFTPPDDHDREIAALPSSVVAAYAFPTDDPDGECDGKVA